MDRTCRAGSGLSGKKKILLIVCLIVVALLVGYGILCGAAGRDVIYPHVTVEAVDLGGMTKEEAQAGSSPGRDAGRGLHRLHRPGGDPDRGGPPLQRGHRLRGHR